MMKKVKSMLFIIVLIFSSSLVSCGFVSYVPGENQEAISKLEANKKEYSSKIDSVSNEKLYYEKERSQYISYVVEAKSEIEECIDLESIVAVYNTYVGYINNLKTISIYEKELADKKNEYINKIASVSAPENYREAEKENYRFYIENAIKDINSCTSIDNVEVIYDTYEKVILGIKTDAQYLKEEALALAVYKENTNDILKSYIDLSLYRENEKNSIKEYIDKYIAKINDAKNTQEIDNLLIDYKISVYQFKTDKELYEEELNQLINDSITEMSTYVKLDDYRSNEALIIKTIINTFNSDVASKEGKEEVTKCIANYKTLIDTVKTDAELYEEERLQLVEECYNEMLTLVDLSSMTEEASKEYVKYCDNVKQEMKSLSTKELIKSRLSKEKQELYTLGAQGGDQNSLSELQELLVNDLENYLDLSLYREAQQSEILSIINSQGSIIKKQGNYNETMNAVNESHQKLDAVLTNDQMWEKEDEEFFTNLHSLYGDNILTPPTSLTEAKDHFELASIIDYYAFYQLDYETFLRDNFRVKCDFSTLSPMSLRNKVYWHSELCNVAVGITCEYDLNSQYYVFHLYPFKFATVSNSNSHNYVVKKSQKIEYQSSKEVSNRDDSFESFKYYQNDKKINVWNSQQLWYALEHNYVPICDENSPADEILKTAKSILRDIVSDDMSDLEKIWAIFSWLGNNAKYDNSAYCSNNDDPEVFPAKNYVASYFCFAEGVFLDHIAVCSGFAKAYIILLKIEGIAAKKVISRNTFWDKVDTINTVGGFGFHEFVYINVDDKWYYSDPEKSSLENDRGLPSFIYMLLPPSSQDYGVVYMYPELIMATSWYEPFYCNLFYKEFSVFDLKIIDSFSKNGIVNSCCSLFVEYEQFLDVTTRISSCSNLEYKYVIRNINNTNIVEFIMYIV